MVKKSCDKRKMAILIILLLIYLGLVFYISNSPNFSPPLKQERAAWWGHPSCESAGGTGCFHNEWSNQECYCASAQANPECCGSLPCHTTPNSQGSHCYIGQAYHSNEKELFVP